MTQKVEFIESYIKIDGSDYQWNDNHGELIRCKDCKHFIKENRNVPWNMCEMDHIDFQSDDWFCADGERRDADG